jgi:hypothetical protein
MGLKMRSNGRELERFLVEEFWGTSSEKGNRRKYTENRVTR